MKLTIIASAALVALPLSVAAQDMNVARSLAATCANCHGTDGRGVGGMDSSCTSSPRDIPTSRST